MTETPEIEAGHQTLEDMHALGYTDLTYDKVEKMDQDELTDISGLCEVDRIDADNCIPCRATVLLAGPAQQVENEVQAQTEAEYTAPPIPDSPSDLLRKIDETRRDVVMLLTASQGGQRAGNMTLTQEELALLVVAATRYTDQQAVLGGSGFVLSPEEIQNVSEVRSLVERIRQGA